MLRNAFLNPSMRSIQSCCFSPCTLPATQSPPPLLRSDPIRCPWIFSTFMSAISLSSFAASLLISVSKRFIILFIRSVVSRPYLAIGLGIRAGGFPGRKEGRDRRTGAAWSITLFSFFNLGIPSGQLQALRMAWFPLQYRLSSITSGAANATTSTLKSGLRQSLGGQNVIILLRRMMDQGN